LLRLSWASTGVEDNLAREWLVKDAPAGKWDEFLQVVIEILFVKRRRVDRVEELLEVSGADFDSILASLIF
jgi:hypothetical protein